MNDANDLGSSITATLETADVVRKLARHAQLTVENVTAMAECVRVLEDRGFDLEQLPPSLLGMVYRVRRVAYGQLVPEAMVKLQGNPMLLDRVSGLPPAEQRRLSSDDPVRVMVRGDGEVTHRLVHPLRMGRAEVDQVFAGDHLRDDNEQLAYLSQREQAARFRSAVRLDARRGGIVVRGVFVSRDELAKAIADLNGPAPADGGRPGRIAWYDTDLDKAKVAVELADLGVPVKRIADRLGLTAITVSKGLDVLRQRREGAARGG